MCKAISHRSSSAKRLIERKWTKKQEREPLAFPQREHRVSLAGSTQGKCKAWRATQAAQMSDPLIFSARLRCQHRCWRAVSLRDNATSCHHLAELRQPRRPAFCPGMQKNKQRRFAKANAKAVTLCRMNENRKQLVKHMPRHAFIFANKI